MLQALCLCPTRELAQQTVRVIEALARFTATSIFIAIPQKADGLPTPLEPADESGKWVQLHAVNQAPLRFFADRVN